MEREKAALKEIAQAHEFEIISLGGGRPHMDLPQYREAAQRLEAVQEQVTAAEHDIAELEKQKKALQGTVRRLQAAEKVRVDLETVQPERTLTGAVRGVTVEQVEELKGHAAAVENFGNFFAQNCFAAASGVVLIQGTLSMYKEVTLPSIAMASIPVMVITVAFTFVQVFLFDRKVKKAGARHD